MSMEGPFLDLRQAYLEIRAELDEAYLRVMNSGWYILGEEARAFEQEFAAYCGTKHCVGVGNCLDALHMILRAYDVGDGDEVIVPANTYIATWLAVSYAGATVVPVEPIERLRIPAVFFTEGGGGRPGDTDIPVVSALDVPSFALWARRSGVVPRIFAATI